MRKEDSDPVFETIIKKWIANYDQDGNFEAAAALYVFLIFPSIFKTISFSLP